MAHKFALIGQGISHSKSPELYSRILQTSVDYSLIDLSLNELTLSFEKLLRTYNFISITAPYKTWVAKRCNTLVGNITAVNAVKLVSNKVVGCNTDLMAIYELLPHSPFTLVFGDGAMSKTVVSVLKMRKAPYGVRSRKLGNLNFDNISPGTLIINTCSRDYVFNPPLRSDVRLWDLNYSQANHLLLASKFGQNFEDGLLLLEEQAKFALSFWSSRF